CAPVGGRVSRRGRRGGDDRLCAARPLAPGDRLATAPAPAPRDEIDVEPDAAAGRVAAETPAVGEHVDEVQPVLDPSARPRAGVWKREEARSGVGDLDADGTVGGLDAEYDDIVLSEPGVPDGVGDELARQQRGDELEVLVPVQLGRTRN